MKTKFTLLFLLGCASYAFSQITITNANFPKAGDTLKTIYNGNFSGTLNMGTAGDAKTWDFSALASGLAEREYCKNASEGSDAAKFPTANLLINSNGQAQYFLSTTNMIEGLGFGGQNPVLGGDLVVKYTKKPTFRVAPLTFNMTTGSVSQFNVDLGSEIIPDSLLATLPLKPDSVRIQFNNTLAGKIDAWGTLKLKNKTFDVLREKATVIFDSKIFVKISFLGWLDATALLSGAAPAGFENFLGSDTTVVYNFYSNTKKEAIASVEYDVRDQFQGVTFVDLGNTSSTDEVPLKADISVFPNPASDLVRISTNNIKDGRYLITISDTNGKVLKFDNAFINSGEVKDVDVSGISSGIYIVSIRDTSGEKVHSAKIILK